MLAVQVPYKTLEKRMVALLLGSVALWFLSAFILSPKTWAAGTWIWGLVWMFLIGMWVGASWGRE